MHTTCSSGKINAREIDNPWLIWIPYSYGSLWSTVCQGPLSQILPLLQRASVQGFVVYEFQSASWVLWVLMLVVVVTNGSSGKQSPLGLGRRGGRGPAWSYSGICRLEYPLPITSIPTRNFGTISFLSFPRFSHPGNHYILLILVPK